MSNHYIVGTGTTLEDFADFELHEEEFEQSSEESFCSSTPTSLSSSNIESLDESRPDDTEEERVALPDHPTKPFICTAREQRSSKKKPSDAIYSASFNPYIPANQTQLLATAAGCRITIYELALLATTIKTVDVFNAKTLKTKKKKQLHLDAESYYGVIWCLDEKMQQTLLVFGGHLGFLCVYSFEQKKILRISLAHGNAINEVRNHPSNPLLFATASRDMTAAIWNVRRCRPLLVVATKCDVNNQLITVDFSWCGQYLLTGGMDHFVKVWRIGDKAKRRIEITSSADFPFETGIKEVTYPRMDAMKFLERQRKEYSLEPVAQTNQVHENYVDSVRVMGNLIVSKSPDCSVCVWKFGDFLDDIAGYASVSGITDSSGDFCEPIEAVTIFSFSEADLCPWFIKFDVDPLCKWILCGDSLGRVVGWKMGTTERAGVYDFEVALSKNNIRQVTFSRDGLLAAAVGDEGVIYRLDRVASDGRRHVVRRRDVDEHSHTYSVSTIVDTAESENLDMRMVLPPWMQKMISDEKRPLSLSGRGRKKRSLSFRKERSYSSDDKENEL